MRTDILERREEILKWIEEKQSKAYICKQLLCKQETLNSYLEKMGIKYSGVQERTKDKISNSYITAEKYIQKDYVKSSILKEKLIREGIKEARCENCGLSKWLNVNIPLELHHVDGNHYNNNFANLKILCPNCHALQTSNAGANIGNYLDILKQQKRDKQREVREKNKILCPICNKNFILKTSKQCNECYAKSQQKIERPSRDKLKDLIRNNTFVSIGKLYGVSDNAIRKWCEYYNLPKRKCDIKKYSNKEWNQI